MLTMTTKQDYNQQVLSILYNAKKNGVTRKEINKQIQNLIIKDNAGMFEVINELNKSGYTHIIAKRAIGKNFFTSIPEDYLTLKGEEYFKKYIHNVA